MIEIGFLPDCKIDDRTNCVVFEKAADPLPVPQPEEAPQLQEITVNERQRALRNILDDIHRVCWRVRDEEVLQRAKRIEQLAAEILSACERDPGKFKKIDELLQNYLPTTWRMLESYADTAAAGVNVDAAKNDIRQVLDKLITGFEEQLDALYADDVLKVSRDVEVLKTMMLKDGMLAGGLTQTSSSD